MRARDVEGRFKMVPGGVSLWRWRAAALAGVVLFLALATTALVLVGLRSPQPTAAVLKATREIRPGMTISVHDVAVTHVFVQDSSVLAALARESELGRIVGQTAVARVPAGGLVPADVAVPQRSAGMWSAALPVKRMPADLRAGDHVALLVEGSQGGQSIDFVVIQDVQVLRVGSNSADLWLPARVVAQIEWYADHGGVVLLKMPPGAVQSDLPAGGGP